MTARMTRPTWAELNFLHKSFETNCGYIRTESTALVSQHDVSLVGRFRAMHVLFTLMVTIETLLAMTFVLSRRRLKSFARDMMRYDSNQIDQVIDDIRAGKLDGRYAVFGLPNPRYIALQNDDRRFIHALFLKMSENYLAVLREIGDFYDNHRSAYGKLKHGLMFDFSELNGGTSTGTKVIVTYDRNEKGTLRGEHYSPQKNPSPPGVDWFNVVSLVPQEEATYEKYAELSDSILKLAQETVRNYLSLSWNRGRDYLPVGVDEMLRARNDTASLRRYEEIKKSLESFMYVPSSILNIECRFHKRAAERISADFRERYVSVHWYPKSDAQG
jgi:hypothetical protein